MESQLQLALCGVDRVEAVQAVQGSGVPSSLPSPIFHHTQSRVSPSPPSDDDRDDDGDESGSAHGHGVEPHPSPDPNSL